MAKNINKATEPKIDLRPEQPYMGIRVQTSFQGMFKVVDGLRKELSNWFKEQDIEPAGPPFLRYHVIDMAGEMDIEYGIPVEMPLPESGRITADVRPAGRYISLIYSGSGLQGNKKLIEYIKENNIPIDRWDNEKGDVFRCRCETYLTDPKVEPRKTKWDIDLAIKLVDV